MGREDIEIVRAAQHEDDHKAEQAFAVLVDRWKDRIYRYSRRLLRNDHDAEDVAAETFLRAWRFLPRLRDPERFGPWLYRIAGNVARNHLRERGLRARASSVGSTIDEFEAQVSPAGVRADLRDALGHLPTGLFQVLQDKYASRMTYQEIADRDAVSSWTVKDRLRRAREQLERVLAATGYLGELAGQVRESREAFPRGGDADDDIGGLGDPWLDPPADTTGGSRG